MVIGEDATLDDEMFGKQLVDWCERQSKLDNYGTFEVGEEVLEEMDEKDVFIVNMSKHNANKPVKYFKNRVNEVLITMCDLCFTFFKTVRK